MISQLTHYEDLRQKIFKKESFTLSEVKQVFKFSTNPIQCYLALAALYFYIRHISNYNTISQEFAETMQLIPRQMFTTHLFQLLTLKVWRAETDNLQLKKNCKILRILAEWMSFYEQTLSKTEHDVFINLFKFLQLNTSCNLQRIVFIDQAFDDLNTVITFPGFWQKQQQKQLFQQQISQLHDPPTYENLKALVDIITLIVPKIQLYIQSIGQFYNPLLKYLDGIDKYQTFIYRSIKYLLSYQKYLSKYQRQLTIASLIFLQKASKQIIVQIVNLLILKTSKVVRFTVAVHYQKLLDVLYKHDKLDIVQQIQNLPEIRQLVMRNIERTLTLQLQNVSDQSLYVTVNQRQSATFYFQVTKPGSLIILQYILEGDIGVSLNYQGDLWLYSGNNYLKEQKSRSKNIQIMARGAGLHSLIFDNKYSWFTAKSIKFNLKIFKPYEQCNSQFNQLVYPDEYTPWDGYRGIRFDDEQGQFLNIWKSQIGQKSDLIIFQQRYFFCGVITHVKKFNLSPIQQKCITKCLIVGEQGQYQQIIKNLKKQNPQLRVRYCEYQDL